MIFATIAGGPYKYASFAFATFCNALNECTGR